MPFSEQSMAWEMQNISPLRQEMHVGMTRELLAENVAGVGQANVTALMKNVHQRTLYIITALNLVDLYIYIYIYIHEADRIASCPRAICMGCENMIISLHVYVLYMLVEWRQSLV
jgi:hypothetical protein